MSATVLSDKALHLDSHHSRPKPHPTLSSISAMSSGMTTPLMTPSFEPNTPFNEDNTVPALISLLQRTSHLDPKVALAQLDMPDLDLSQSISALLKAGTSRAHVEAENSLGAAALVKGELELQEYVRWCAVLWRVYDVLELGLDEHASNPVLAPTYDPKVLARADALSQDISYLLTLLPASITSQPSSSLPDGPLPPFPLPAFLAEIFTNPPPALTTYLDHLRQLASSGQSASGLLAHAYVRYLGDLSGGQFIAARVKRAYGLDKGTDGLKFYHFDLANRVTDGEESKSDGRRKAGEVKDWFRRGMDEGVGDDEDLKASLVREANFAFALNTYLFSVIQLPQTIFNSHKTETQGAAPSSQHKQVNAKTSTSTTKEVETNPMRRVVLLGIAFFIGLGITEYGPVVAQYVSRRLGGSSKSEL